MRPLLRFFVLLLVGLFISGPVFSQDYALSPEEVQPVLINTTIPDVHLYTPDNKKIALREKVSTQPAVVIFYRGGWCPYCSRHMMELQQIEDELVDLGYQILAISADRPEALAATSSDKGISYTLLSDKMMEASKAFGLAYKVDPATVTRYREVGIDLNQNSGDGNYLLPVPAAFIVDKQGTIKFSYVNPDYKQRINGEVLLASAKAYKE